MYLSLSTYIYIYIYMYVVRRRRDLASTTNSFMVADLPGKGWRPSGRERGLALAPYKYVLT